MVAPWGTEPCTQLVLGRIFGKSKWCINMFCLQIYHLVIEHSHGKSPFLIGKPSINGPFSIAILNYHRVYQNPSNMGISPNDQWGWTIKWFFVVFSARDDAPIFRMKDKRQRMATHFFKLSLFLVDSTWLCLKIGYIPNYSHLIGIIIINHRL